jgi:hypothetical protein
MRQGCSWEGKGAREGLLHPAWNTRTNILIEKLSYFLCAKKFKFDPNKGKLITKLRVSPMDPGILFGGGSTNSVEDRSQRGRSLAP